MLDKSDDTVLPWYKQFWPWFLIALPLSVVIAGFYTLMLAINNPDAMVQDNYYKDGLAINQQLHQDEQAKQMKLRATLLLDSKNFTSLKLDLDGMLEQQPQTLYLKLYSPSQASADWKIELQLQDDGFYHATFDSPISERWYLDLSDQADQQSGWRLKGEWDTRRHQSLVLIAP